MYEQVRATLKKFQMVEPKDKILVGLSGGADSVCLLYILHGLKDALDFDLHAAHIHHGIRGEEADRDAVFSKDLCQKLGISFHLVYRNVQEEAKVHKISVEEAGRRARYEVFEALRASMGGGKIAVAHHMNDQAETVLFNLMRGSGLKGLGGMKPVRDAIIRPLIECTRTQIEGFCKQEHISYITDSTNESNAYSRNKVRNELIPYMEQNFNTALVTQLSHMSELLREDMSYLEFEAQRLFGAVVKKSTEHKVVLDGQLLIHYHPAMRKRIFLLAIQLLGKNLQGYENKHMAMMDSFIFMGTGKKLTLLEGLIVEKVYQEVHFSIEEEKGSFWEYILCKDDTIIELSEINTVMQTRIFDHKNTIKIGENRYTKWFDYDKIICDLSVRNRRDGDYIYLKGTSLKKKLKDFFIDQKIPRDSRGVIPLITDGSNVLWIVGYRMNEDFKVSPETKKILEVKFFGGTKE